MILTFFDDFLQKLDDMKSECQVCKYVSACCIKTIRINAKSLKKITKKEKKIEDEMPVHGI